MTNHFDTNIYIHTDTHTDTDSSVIRYSYW